MELYLASDISTYRIIPHQVLTVLTNNLQSYQGLGSHRSVDMLIDSKDKFNLFLAGADKFGREEFKQYMELYLANPEEEQLTKLGANVLFNFIDGKQRVNECGNYNIGGLFVDSGAFSAWTRGIKIDVDEYITWLNDRPQIDLFGQVDVIPGDRVHGATIKQVRDAADATWDNYLYMRERVNNKNGLLYTYHVGEPIKYLEQALNWVDDKGNQIPYIALGGMVGKPKSTRRTFLDLCFDTIEKSVNKNIKVHTFGMTDFDFLERYPIESADSTSWIMVGAMGNIMTEFGIVTVSDNKVNDASHYSRQSLKSQNYLKNYVERFGFELDELAVSREKRIMLNAMYMLDKARNLDKKPRKRRKNRRLL